MIKWESTGGGGPKLSCVVLVPSAEMRDLDGNGPELQVRDALLDLARALVRTGHLVCRFDPEAPSGVPGSQVASLDFERLKSVVGETIRHPEAKDLPLVLLGVGEGADLIAKDYYRLLSLRAPGALILLSASVGPFYLNGINCPYLTVHGKSDPLLETLPFEHIKQAVHHHEMRFPDPTAYFLLPGYGHELGEAILDERVTEEVTRWLRKALTYNRQWRHWAEKRKVA